MIKDHSYTKLENGNYEAVLKEELTPRELFFRLNSYRVISSRIQSEITQIKLKKSNITKIMAEVRAQIDNEYKNIPKMSESQKDTEVDVNLITDVFADDPKFAELEKEFEEVQKKKREEQKQALLDQQKE